MQDLRIEGRGDVKAGEEFGAQVERFRSKYDSLLETLGKLGTEVMRNRTLEVDLDIAPHDFVRSATHNFIFPPQPNISVRTTSTPVPGTEPYTLTYETVEATYNKDAVTGHIIVTYDDAGSVPRLEVRDALPNSSILLGQVSAQLETTFEPEVQ